MEQNKKRRRRRHPEDFKARAVATCQVPGASFAGVALEWQLNANLLRRWVKETLVRTALVAGAEDPAPEKLPTFVPVAVRPPKPQADRCIRIQVRADGELPIDINWLENRIRPVALGRNNWLFAGSDRAGRRSVVVMSLIQTARLHGLDPYAYLRDVLERLPATPNSRIEELLPGTWKLKSPANSLKR